MNSDDVEVLERETIFKGYFRVDRWRVKHRTFEGGWSGTVTREVFERGHAVAVLPYDPVRDEVVLIEQYRVGAQASLKAPVWNTPPSPWLIEVVAGIVEDGETPEDVARRELIEEAGCQAKALHHMMSYLVTPGGSSETIAVFAAHVDASNAGGIHGLDHEHEDIRVFTRSTAEAYAMLAAGEINNGTTIMALQWLQSHQAMLRDKWSG